MHRNRKLKSISAMFLCVLAAPVYASSLTAEQPGEISSSQPGEISSSQKGKIGSNQKGEINLHQKGEISTEPAGVDPGLCRALVKHTPRADVAYQPGVDAAGNAVAPADLPGQPQIKMPDKIQIPLTVSLAQAAHLNTSQYPFNQIGTGSEALIGMITVQGDKVFFNDQPLSDTQQDNLAVLCMKPNGN